MLLRQERSPAPLEISGPYSMIDEEIVFSYHTDGRPTVRPPQRSEYQSSRHNPPEVTSHPTAPPPYQWQTPENWLVSKADKSSSSVIVTESAIPPRSSRKWVEMLKSKRRIFRNKGLDDNGNLMPYYDDMSEPDWGVPTEWQKMRKEIRDKRA